MSAFVVAMSIVLFPSWLDVTLCDVLCSFYSILSRDDDNYWLVFRPELLKFCIVLLAKFISFSTYALR